MKYTAESTLLSEKVILVTGAGDGIGAAVAKSYSKHGAIVILLDKEIKKLEQVYDAIEAEGNVIPAIYPLDLKGASVTDYETMVATIVDNFGRLDGLVHCAAGLGQIAPVEHQDITTWMETIHINLTAPYLLTRSCIPLLKDQEDSSIIFTSDDNKDKAYWAAYGVAKAGIETLTNQLADEFESEGKIRVNCVIPGSVQTVLTSRAFPGINPNTLATPDEISPIYLYLMGRDSLKESGKCFSAQ